MKRFFLISLLVVGIFNTLETKSATYTHRLNYTNTNENEAGSLEGLVTFEDTQDPGTNLFVSQIDSQFITNVTYTYLNGAGQAFTLNSSDMNFMTITHNNPGSTNYQVFASDGLFNQLQNLQFFGEGSFTLSGNVGGGNEFIQDVNDGSLNTDDYILSSTSYVSPGPLPLMGLLPAFGTIKRLKNRFKLNRSN